MDKEMVKTFEKLQYESAKLRSSSELQFFFNRPG